MRRLVLLLPVWLFAPAVRAESAAPEVQLQPVLVPAPPPDPGEAERAPAASTTIIDVTSQAPEGRSTAELVARAPGVFVHAYGGAGQLATISLRGASSDQVLILLDGVPLSGALSGTVDLATVPEGFLDRIEVLRGVLGPIYGPGALGGAVNLVTRAPQRGPPSLEAELRGGSFGTGELRLAGQSSGGPGAALVAFDALGSEGNFEYLPIDASAEIERQNNDARQLAGLGRYALALGNGRDVDVLAQVDHLERGLAGTVTSPSFTDHMQDTRVTTSARVSQRLTSGELALRAFATQDDLAVALDGQPANPQLDELAGAEARLTLNAGHHGLAFTAEGSGEQVSQAGAPEHARPAFGLGASDEWLLAGGALSILPAARVDEVGAFTGFSPQLAVAFRPIDALELRTCIARSFRAPTFGELYLDEGLTVANPDLQPERATSLEVGATLSRGMLHASASGFASEYGELIVYELYPPFRAKPFNVGTAGIAGVESEASVQPRRELELTAMFTRQWTEDLLDDARYYGHELAYHPHLRGGARAAWSGDRLTAHVEAFAQSSQFLSRANTAELPGRVDASLGAAVRPLADQPLWFGLEMQNALDVQGEDLYGYPLPGRALYAMVRLAAPSPEHP